MNKNISMYYTSTYTCTYGVNSQKKVFPETNPTRSVRHNFHAWLPDGLFSNQNPNLGKFWIVLQWNIFLDLWSIELPFRTFYGYLVYFEVILVYFPVLVCCANKNLATLLSPLSNSGKVLGGFLREELPW
jgi:hypothetical protein